MDCSKKRYFFIYFLVAAINYETEQIDFPKASVGCLVNATANKQAKLLTRENFFMRFTTSENLPLLVKTPQSRSGRRKRPCIWSIPCLMFSNCDI